MKARSAKNKGNRFEQYLVQLFRETVDVNAHKTNASGAGIDKMDVRIPGINLEIEAKNAKRFNLVHDWDQMKSQLTVGNMGILAIRHPKKPEFQETLVVIDMNDFISLLQNQTECREVSFTADRDSKYKVMRLVESAKAVLKTFNQDAN